MKKHILSMFSLTLAALMLFGSCGTDTPEDSGTEAVQSSDVTTAALTDAVTEKQEETTVAYDSVVPGDKTQTLESAELGLVPLYVSECAKNCVKATLDGEKCQITPFAEGTDTVTVYNSYGETATVTAEVKSDLTMTLKTEAFVKPAFSINAKEEGAKSGSDITSVVQSCIDKAAKNGKGTVYVPAGTYTLGTLSLKDGVTLRFEGFIQDSSQGYSSTVKRYISSGKIAVIKTNGSSTSSFFFVNVDLPQGYCTSGHSDFTVTGGMFDCQGKMKLLGMSCAENVVFENIIVKDVPNNHAMQIEGCKNVTVENLMFAGYNWPTSNGVLTRETIQLESTTPGAIGSNYDTNVIQCNDGDYNHCYNVKITRCYFGKSDTYGPQLVAVGHHSNGGGLVCDGFEFSYNTVDNPLYCGLHLPNYINVKIFGNNFISTSQGTSASLATDSALISLYCFNKDITYTDANGNKIYYAYASELPGVQNVDIYDNTMTLGGSTWLKAIYISGVNNTNRNGAAYTTTGVNRVAEYGGTPFRLNGYILKSNQIYNININNNTISFKSALGYKNSFMLFKNICGLSYGTNTIENTANLSFTNDWKGISGINFDGSSVICGNNMYRRSISMISNGTATLTIVTKDSSVNVPNPKNSLTLTLTSDGNGSVELTADAHGNLTATPVAKDGYVFDGWQTADGKAADLTQVPTSGLTYTAVFVKK